MISPTVVVPVVVAVSWLVLPFTAGDAFAAALDDRSGTAQWVIGITAWAAWALGVAVIAVARTSSLTVARYVVPAGLVATVVAAAVATTDDPATGLTGDGLPLTGTVGLVCAALAAALILTALYGDRSINGSSYGAERRFALRPPAATMVLVPALWVVAVAAMAAGPVVLATGAWVPGAAATIAGLALAAAIMRRTHILTRRWLVLVPAGVVVHDPWVLADSLLVQRANLVDIVPAAADTTATDLTAGAAGLALEIRLRAPSPIVTTAARRQAEGSLTAASLDVDAVLVTPTRPGAVMRTLANRSAR